MGRLTKPMQAIVIMQEFGWSWDEYLATPQYILTLIIEKMKRDKKEQDLKSKRDRG